MSLLVAAAFAVDLTIAVTAWEHVEAGPGGSDGDDRAAAVAADASGNLVVAGWIDGDPGHGHDALLLVLDPTGGEVLRDVRDTGLVGGATASSDDRWNGVAVVPGTGELALCGSAGSPTDEQVWYTGLYTASPLAAVWAGPFDEGPQSPTQACHAVAIDPTRGVVTAGWSWGNDALVGQWRSFRQTFAFGAYDLLYALDESAFPAVPDQANAVAVDVGGNLLVAGSVGVAGSAGSTQNDTDGLLVKLDRTGRELWTTRLEGKPTPGLFDTWSGVAVSPVTNDVVVVGQVNLGLDNADNADIDGVAMAFDPIGYLGDGQPRWAQDVRLDADPHHASFGAVAFDAAGALFVGGRIDEVAGTRWVLIRLDPLTGAELARFTGPLHGAGAPTSLAVTDDLLVLSGWVDDGQGPDFAVLAIGDDTDGDGVADVLDGCPDDDDKDDPGVCGCDQPDIDSDSDGLLNCEDGCPSDASKSEPLVCGCGIADDDADGDGTADCDDSCDSDPDKSAPGVCGCGTPDEDVDGDGLLTCQDECPDSAPGAVVDAVGCERVAAETGDTGVDDAKVDGGGGGCGCDGGNAGVAWAFALAMPFLLRRRTDA